MKEIAEREGIDLSGSYAYSDSMTDLPMLEAVGHPVAVNPDRELRREAERRGWQIRDFRRPVRLRERFPRVHAPPPSFAAVGAALAAAALLAWVYLRPDLGVQAGPSPGPPLQQIGDRFHDASNPMRRV